MRKKPAMKMIVTNIPSDIYEYFKKIAKNNNQNVDSLCAILLVSCAKGMISKDIQDLKNLENESNSNSDI